ncbi:MAG: hypothetical protein H7A55_15510 [Verrucomicrobiaceae bacterium]|nr:hypothetical protein [Verrucomicrobiaceae bacterium]
MSADQPAVKVYQAHHVIDETKDYLWTRDKAIKQTDPFLDYKNAVATVSGTSTTWLPADTLRKKGTVAEQHPFLMFEGSAKGTGQLCLVLKMGSSSEAEGPGIWLNLADVQEMFQNAEGTPGFPYPNPLDYLEQEPPRPATHFQTISWPGRGTFKAEPDETDEALVLVHGWNMTDPDRRTFSESFFKRLWWKGYKGRFASFAWPTYNSDHDFAGWIPDHYNKSEYVGWKYGPGLKAYMDSISKSSKHLAAHSMGNIVVASALKAGLRPSSYVAMEAAMPA